MPYNNQFIKCSVSSDKSTVPLETVLNVLEKCMPSKIKLNVK